MALIVGIDRLLNEGRVFINVLGNALGAIVIGKWENGFDADRAREVLAGDLEFNIDDEDEHIDEPNAIDRAATTEEYAVTAPPTSTKSHASS